MLSDWPPLDSLLSEHPERVVTASISHSVG
jgi:hypothetical protein